MAELDKLINFLSTHLQKVSESNDLTSSFQTQKISVFHGLTRPSISIQSYLERIFKFANCSPCCFIVAYIYLDRFSQRQPLLPINSFNVHRLLITSVMVAVKFMDDVYYNNAYYAKIGGITTTEMNYLEVDFLFGVGFNLNVTPTTFSTYCSYLQTQMIFQRPPISPPNHSPPSSSSLNCVQKSLKPHLCFNEDNNNNDSSHQQHHQQQQQQQLAV